MKKLLSLFVLLVAIVTGAWAETTTLFDANDFASETVTGTVTKGNATWYGDSKSAVDNGKTISEVEWSKRIKLGGSSTFKSGADFVRVLALTVSGAGTLHVYFASGKSGDSRSVYVSKAPSSTNRDTETAVGSGSDSGSGSVINVTADAAGTYYIWSDNNISLYGVTFEASAPVGPVDPVFSLSTSDLQVGETAKILVGGVDNFADNFTAGTLWQSEPDCISLSADGVVTALKNTPANYYFHFFGTSKDDTKYNSKSSGNLSLTIATKYAISKTTPENGSIAASATSAPEGDEITLTATPDFRYALSAWNVYKTGEPATTVTVTNNKFTMPAYAVTVDATFAADTKKQVLYVTGDGSVNAGDDLYAALGEDYTVTVAANSASKTVTDFDLVVLHESVGGKDGTSGLAAAAKAADVPVLNTKSYFYNSGRWDWGSPNAGGTVNGCSQNAAYSNIASHPIFNGVTVTDGFVQVVGTAAAKAMQPVGTIAAGYEGYLLATSPNEGSGKGKGAAIHELTAAERGVASAKYIMISVSNASLNDLTANGQLLFKNAAAYLMSDEAWTPTLATTNITLNAKGYGTYSKANDFTFSGAKAYKMALDESAKTITGTEVTGKIVAGEGILFKGEPNAEVTITGATWATALEGNSLSGTTTASGTKAEKPSICYTLSGDTFKKFVGTEFNDNKAYIEGTTELNSLDIVFEDELATAVDAIAEASEAETAPVKVIKNGKLYIGNFNVAGQQVK